MASTSKRRKDLYQESDILDGFLISKIAKHINYTKLGLLGEHLKLTLPEKKTPARRMRTRNKQIDTVSKQSACTFNMTHPS